MEKQWYRKGLVKGVLAAAALVMSAILSISIVWMLSSPGAVQNRLNGQKIDYEESENFTERVYEDTWTVWNGIEGQKLIELLNDEKRTVDIKSFVDTGRLDGETVHGISYKAKDLLAWSRDYYDDLVETGEYQDSMEDPIIVCQKGDNTYDYFHYSEFKKKVDDGEFRFVMETDDYSSKDILGELKDGNWYEEDSSISKAVLDQENKVQYISCWNYDGYWIEDTYQPVEGSLLKIVSENKEWNGKLQDAYRTLGNVLDTLGQRADDAENFENIFSEGMTNLIYIYDNSTDKKVITNRNDYENYAEIDANIADAEAGSKYILLSTGEDYFESNINNMPNGVWKSSIESAKDAYGKDFRLLIAVDQKYPVNDIFKVDKATYTKVADRAGLMLGLAVLSTVILLGSIVWLTIVAGRKPEDEGIYLNQFDRWKTELGAVIVIGGWMALVFIAGSFVDYMGGSSYIGMTGETLITGLEPGTMILAVLFALVSCAAFLIGWLSLVKRIKARTLWKNSILKYCCHGSAALFRNLPIIWKSLPIFFGFWFTQMLMWIYSYSGILVLIGLAADVAAVVYIFKQSIGKKKILDGIRYISSGHVDYKIPLNGLKGEQHEIAGRMNIIGEGLNAALEEGIKNERMKTELITNVSHDIKTPLTSIINYIDLLQRENIQDEKIQGYLNILEAKAQRLKHLTEDVVEASKVSSGNVTLEYMPINLVEMVQQTSGEFAEKFEKRNLTEILTVPEEPAVVMVDGQKMWRILENIYNNAAKYAMEGTRIYAELKETESEVIFSLKNVSEKPLNISAEELTERFIRGDVARSTEGSGLGLSIARSLAELMKGRFELYLDGDLFRVTITFARVKK